MALNPGEIAEQNRPKIDAPTPGGSSPMPGQAPPMEPDYIDPYYTDAGVPANLTPSAPARGSTRGTRETRAPFYGREPEETVDIVWRTQRRTPVGWTAPQRDVLSYSLKVQDATLVDGPRLTQMVNSIMENTDASIIELG